MYDVVIIGAGPSGLTAAANTSLRGLRSLVIEKQEIPRGPPRILYPDKIIRDHPGFPVGILGKELSRMLFMQAKNSGAEIKLGEEALKIVSKEKDLLEVRTVEDRYQAKRVILCTGIYDIPRKLEILEDYAGPNIHYEVENPRIFKKKRLLIVGGGDHAFDTALQLKDTAESIAIVVKDK
jgi:thioredoxin reductase (NADPH)